MLVFVMLLVTMPMAYALESIDLSVLTLDGLLELRQSLDEQIYYFCGKAVIPISGEYVVRKDIATGLYMIATYGDPYDSLVMKATVH